MTRRHATLMVCAASAVLLAGCGERQAATPAERGPDAAALRDVAADRAPVPDAAPTGEASVSDAGAPAPCPVQGYAPCGGALPGSWRLVSFCPEDLAAAQALFEHPYDDRPECQRPDNPVEGQIATDGRLTITASEMVLAATRSVSVRYGFTDGCLAAIGREPLAPAAACAALASPGKLRCSYDAAAQPPCSCTATLPAEPLADRMPYALTGAESLTAAGGELRGTFCVAGDVLTFDWEPHPVSWRYWIVRREP